MFKGRIKFNIAAAVTAAAAAVFTAFMIFSCAAAVFAADSATLEAASDTIYDAFLESEAEIDVSAYSLTADELREVISDLLETKPDLFYVSNEYSYNYKDEDDGRKIISFTPTYTLSGAELTSAKAVVQDLIDDIVAGASSNMSTVEKLLVIHDYLLLHFSYDTTVENRDLYSLATEGSGTCVAYSLAVKAACDELGIECDFAGSDTMNHEWNVVKIGSYWYHMDVSWDDVVPDMAGQSLHKSFLKSDTAIVTSSSTEHTGWTCDYECTSTYYDSYVWSTVTSPFVYIGGEWYSFDASAKTLCRYNLSSGTSTAVASITERWGVSGSTNVYTLAYSGVGVYDGCVYYNDPSSIYSYNVSTGEIKTVITPDTGSYSIYYFTIADDGTLTYYLSDAPNKLYTSSASVSLAEITSTFTVTYMVDGEVYAVGSYLEGETINLPDEPTSSSGTFSRWDSLPDVMPAYDIVVTAVFATEDCDHAETTTYTITEATCTTDGEVEIICTSCGEIIGYQTIPASHTEGEWETVTEATCTSLGERQKKCTVCGEVISTETIPMTDHTYGDWEENEDGETVHVCTVCGHTETYEEATGVTLASDSNAVSDEVLTSDEVTETETGSSVVRRTPSAKSNVIYVVVLVVAAAGFAAIIYLAIAMDKKKRQGGGKDKSKSDGGAPNSDAGAKGTGAAASSAAAASAAAAGDTVLFKPVDTDTPADGDTVLFNPVNEGAEPSGTAATGEIPEYEDVTPAPTPQKPADSSTSTSTTETYYDL